MRPFACLATAARHHALLLLGIPRVGLSVLLAASAFADLGRAVPVSTGQADEATHATGGGRAPPPTKTDWLSRIPDDSLIAKVLAECRARAVREPEEEAARLETPWYDPYLSDFTMADWMARLPDDLLISELSLPGTHDSHSFNGISGLWPWCAVCQRTPLPWQLNAGIRVLDIRLRHWWDDLRVYHGLVDLHASFADWCGNEDAWYDGSTPCGCGGILNACVGFLQNHPGETIFIRVKQNCQGCIPVFGLCTHCRDNSLSFAEAVQAFAARFDKEHFYAWPYLDCGAMPTLGDVRGKIVFLQDFPSDYHVGGDGSSHGLASGRISCTGDFDGDGAVGLTDLTALLAHWGPVS